MQYYFYCESCKWIMNSSVCYICERTGIPCYVFYPSEIREWTEKEITVFRKKRFYSGPFVKM